MKTDGRRPFRCGGWRCQRCGPPKARKTAKAFAAIAAEHKLNYMWSLTLPGKGSKYRGKSIKSREAIGPMWNRLRNYLNSRVGNMKFICVPEPQRDGTAHLHFITDRYIAQNDLADAWARAGGGFTWVERGDVHRTGKYIAKYLAKTWEGPAPWDERTTRFDQDGNELRAHPWRPWRRYWMSSGLRVFRRTRRNPDVILIHATAEEWCEICDYLGSALWKTPPPDS